MTINRQFLRDAFVKRAESWSFCIACWEGGAAANNRVDQFSDLDFILCVDDEMVEVTFREMDSALESIAKIKRRYRPQEPTFNGVSRCYFQFEGMPEYFFMDAVVLRKTAGNKFLEKERHGTPVVYFDKLGIVNSVSADTEDFKRKRRERLIEIESSFPIYQAIIIKELHRERALDALMYFRVLAAFYVDLCGMKYRPFRYDFGLRYAHAELPIEIQNEISRFSYVADIEDLHEKFAPLVQQIEKSIADFRLNSR